MSNTSGLAVFIAITFITFRYAIAEEVENSCWCAGMDAPDAVNPLITKQFKLPLACNKTGKCSELCVSLAKATREDPESLKKTCETLKEANQIKIHVFSKLCEGPYVYSGFNFNTPLCCNQGKFLKCPGMPASGTPPVPQVA